MPGDALAAPPASRLAKHPSHSSHSYLSSRHWSDGSNSRLARQLLQKFLALSSTLYSAVSTPDIVHKHQAAEDPSCHESVSPLLRAHIFELQPAAADSPLYSVLADEAPQLPQSPIITDHPLTTPLSPSRYPNPSFTQPTIFTGPGLSIQPDLQGTTNIHPRLSTPEAAQLTSNDIFFPPLTQPNPRRRRRRSSSPIPLQHEESSGGPESSNTVTEDEAQSSRGPRPSRTVAGRSPARKRPRMTAQDMHYHPDDSTSNALKPASNGEQHLTQQKSSFSNGTNSHIPSNGTSSLQKNALSSSMARSSRDSFYGHDREEVTRLIIQGLHDLDYHGAANKLSEESGYEVESPVVAHFRHAVLQGDWAEAEILLFGSEPPDGGGGVSINNGDHRGLKFVDGVDQNQLRFQLRTQKYLELLESKDQGRALMVLRQELTPLKQDRGQLQDLSSMLVNTPDGLKKEARWDGATGQSRQFLLHDLSTPSVMIPEHRLATLLDQVKQHQISHCTYHNPSAPPSLFADHLCDRDQFPLRTILELGQNAGEVWAMEFSHDGRRLATCGKDTDVLIYDTSVFQELYRLRDHTKSVAYISWSPNDANLITCSFDKTARIWDADCGQCIMKIDHHSEPVTTAAWSPDGKSFVTGSLNGTHRLCLWSLDTGQQLHNWPVEYRVQDCAITPDGRRLVAISDQCQIVVYNFDTHEEEYSILLKSRLTCITVSRDGRYMLINMSNGQIQLIEIETRDFVRRFEGQVQGEYVIRSCFGGADENLVISGSEDSRIYIWHKTTGSLIETLDGHQTPGCVNDVAWNPAHPCMFASGGDDRKIRIWSNDSSEILSKRRSKQISSTSSPHPPMGRDGMGSASIL
ncbi:MAG: hypothetical protein LQ350_007725 [Teloschistes chrysophthalmus]|nr:MAG: hypothetical protein LQ350_007725 [Niorma chrysophthalma]